MPERPARRAAITSQTASPTTTARAPVGARLAQRPLHDVRVRLGPLDGAGADHRADHVTGADRVQHQAHPVVLGAGDQHHLQPGPAVTASRSGAAGSARIRPRYGAKYRLYASMTEASGWPSTPLHQLGRAHPQGPVNVGAADVVTAFPERLPPGGDVQVVGCRAACRPR
jgi:hypothetical protein